MTSQYNYIIVGTLLFVIMAIVLIGFILYYQQKQLKLRIKQQKAIQDLQAEMQRQMLESSLEVQEVERRRIAKDLHDEVGAMLSATKMSLNQMVRKIDSTDLSTLAQQTKELLDESISQVRRISKELVPSTLEEFGLVSALDEFIQKIHVASGVLFVLNHEGIIPPDKRFDKKIELTVYRIAQELVNNALKHAQANEISLILKEQTNHLIFEFNDDGIGFDIEKVQKNVKKGLGLKNIESRLSVVNGTFVQKSELGKGTQSYIEIPI